MDLQSWFAYLASFLTVGSFVIIDLIAATTNALNGALLAQRPDYYRGRQWSVVGIIILAIFISRPFCRILCPLGAFYSLFTRMALVKLEFVEGNCVQCRACVRVCPTGVKPNEQRDSRECIMCLKCLDSCHFRALEFGLRRPLPAPKESPSHT